MAHLVPNPGIHAVMVEHGYDHAKLMGEAPDAEGGREVVSIRALAARTGVRTTVAVSGWWDGPTADLRPRKWQLWRQVVEAARGCVASWSVRVKEWVPCPACVAARLLAGLSVPLDAVGRLDVAELQVRRQLWLWCVCDCRLIQPVHEGEATSGVQPAWVWQAHPWRSRTR